MKLFEVSVHFSSGHILNVLMAGPTKEDAIRDTHNVLRANGVRGQGEVLGFYQYDPEETRAAEVHVVTA